MRKRLKGTYKVAGSEVREKFLVNKYDSEMFFWLHSFNTDPAKLPLMKGRRRWCYAPFKENIHD